MMKKYTFLPLLLAILSLSSCREFFETDSDNVLDEKAYISKESEIYRGFLGIITRIQEVGDHAIMLTDPRSSYLETTGNAPVALQNIGNYEETNNNEYADPTGYYAVIVACNDFLVKIDEFYKKVDGALSDSVKVHIPRLVSCALRDKVWAYYMLGRIYGEAYWYDTNMTELSELTDNSTFEYLDMKGICDKCIDLLDNGIELCGQSIPANLEMDWSYWVDPINGNSSYNYWKQMTPRWIILRAELASWRTNYESEAEAKADWQWVRDNIIQFITSYTSTGVDEDADGDIDTYLYDYFTCTMTGTLYYSYIFYTESMHDLVGEQQFLGAVFYDYQNKQYNRLVQYFCPEYPGDGYYLKPSDYGLSQYNESDLRGPLQKLVCNTLGGQMAFTKNYYTRYNNAGYLRTNIFEIEPTIILFRGHDLHFLLAEAENHLGHWEVAATLLNNGLLNKFPGGYATIPNDSIDGDRIWSPLYETWFAAAGGYGDIGIAGEVRGTAHELSQPSASATAAELEAFAFDPDRIREYDLALADEHLKEYTGEGKSYSYLVKMAERYNDWQIIYDRVKGKYDGVHQPQVASSLQEHRFIHWEW